MRSRRPSYSRWWEVRSIDFSILLYALVAQAGLPGFLYLVASLHAEVNDLPLSLALDATYAGIHAPQYLAQAFVLGWLLLAFAAATAIFSRCYKWPKAIIVFGVLAQVMTSTTLLAVQLYEPFLAVRR